MTIHIQERCVASDLYAGECLYLVWGREKRFYASCVCRKGVHGPVDGQGRLFLFASYREAQALCTVLNASLVRENGEP